MNPKDLPAKPPAEDFVMSYHRVRRALGVLGLALPFALLAGAWATQVGIQPSISDFYHTFLRDLFVGIMFAIGVFLISYKGYPRRLDERASDNAIATLAGLAAFGVALFPNEGPLPDPVTVSQVLIGPHWTVHVHFVSAIVFFWLLAMFCFVKFARGAGRARRVVYYICGSVIVLALGLVVVFSVLREMGTQDQRAWIEGTKAIFWAEALGIWAFGISWLTKGKAERALGIGTGGNAN